MGRPKVTDAHARTTALLDAVIETFKLRGYDGASLSDFAAATGIAKASFYHRFPGGKPDIGRAALAEAGRRFTAHVLRPLQSSKAAKHRLSAMLDGVRNYYSQGTTACLMNTMTLGEGAVLYGRDIRQTIAAWEKLIAQAFEEMGRPQDGARLEAQTMIAQIQGLLVMIRLSGRLEDLANWVEQRKKSLEITTQKAA